MEMENQTLSPNGCCSRGLLPRSRLRSCGDAIRSGANPGREDDPDLEKVGMDLGIFTAFAEGYLSAEDATATYGPAWKDAGA